MQDIMQRSRDRKIGEKTIMEASRRCKVMHGTQSPCIFLIISGNELLVQVVHLFMCYLATGMECIWHKAHLLLA